MLGITSFGGPNLAPALPACKRLCASRRAGPEVACYHGDVPSAIVSTYSASLGLTLLAAVLAVAGIGIAVKWAWRNCETNTDAAQRVRSGQPVVVRVPVARVVREPRN